jgi:hypothetical protein
MPSGSDKYSTRKRDGVSGAADADGANSTADGDNAAAATASNPPKARADDIEKRERFISDLSEW